MSRWHRILLSLLLALALPVQGHAARTMLWCGGMAPPTTQAHRHDAQPSAPAVADEHAAHHHGEAADAKPAGGKCSVCAACCTGAALVQAPLLMPVVRVAPDYAPLTPRLHARVAIDGLERPPRSELA
ncbi:hypothetical protein [Rivibacter subsaxonicus]|uniref:DUF2946 family protein n=1 Tax=Rivibacter subsaxonicus TaxID=457575 RepID=A0A4Q7W1C1_9BURK|nr:hypothetical protein [Rivibacter subsaxonicus]RZU03064.1 hypothetical protein EV670_1097 [Rivibacter subsaxonicus]